MDEQSLKSVDNMVVLKDLNDASILHNLRLRFKADKIYTNVGTILVAVNPFKASVARSLVAVPPFPQPPSLSFLTYSASAPAAARSCCPSTPPRCWTSTRSRAPATWRLTSLAWRTTPTKP